MTVSVGIGCHKNSQYTKQQIGQKMFLMVSHCLSTITFFIPMVKREKSSKNKGVTLVKAMQFG